MNTKFIKRGANILHGWIARSKLATQLYISIVAYLLRRLPDLRIKYQILNSINSSDWQSLDLLLK